MRPKAPNECGFWWIQVSGQDLSLKGFPIKITVSKNKHCMTFSKCVCLHFGSKSLSQQKAKTCKTSWPCSAFYTKGYIEPRLVKLSLHNSPQKKPMLRHVLAWTGPIGRRRGKHRCLQNSCCNLRNAFSRIRLSSTANHLAFRSCFWESRKAI